MSKDNGNEKSKWRGFVEVDLKEEDKKAIKKRKWSAADCMAYLEELAKHNYKVSISLDTNNDAYIVSATGKDENAGWTMSQRHGNLWTAINAHAYAHLEVTFGDWEQAAQLPIDFHW